MKYPKYIIYSTLKLGPNLFSYQKILTKKKLNSRVIRKKKYRSQSKNIVVQDDGSSVLLRL